MFMAEDDFYPLCLLLNAFLHDKIRLGLIKKV